MSVAAMSTHSASAAIPPLPGSAYILVTSGRSLSFFMIACSRPPPPTTMMFIYLFSYPKVERQMLASTDDFL